jgi:hypothetical protein
MRARAPQARCLTSGHDFVYGELLTGDAGGRKALLANYERMDQAPLVPHAEVVAFVCDRNSTAVQSAGSTRTCWRPPSSGV